MATVQTLVDAVLAEGGFDATAAQALDWINQRHKELVGLARSPEALQASGTWSALLPADAVLGDNVTTLQCDIDLLPGLVAGAIATGLRRVEQLAELADAHEGLFREAAEKMRQRVAQRYLTQTTDSVQALLNEAVGADGFDATQAQVLLWLNRRHRDMVARSRAYRDRVSVGPTVAGTAFYAVSDVVETYNVEVAGVPYSKGRRPDVYADSQGALRWMGPDGSGFVVEDVNASSVLGFTLIPVPDTSGLAIDVWAAVMPATLVAGDAATALKVDADCYDGLISGVIATGLARAGQLDLSERHERAFEAAVEKMRVRVKQRYRTIGPAQIRLLGVNA